MRFTTILSFVVALLLAGAAVLGAQQWLAVERAQLAEKLRQEQATMITDAVEAEPKQTIVVATRALEFGDRITADVVREIAWDADMLPDGAFMTVPDLVIGEDDGTSRFSTVSIAMGEPVLASKVTTPGQRAKLSGQVTPGMRAVSIPVNAVFGVGGFVTPGDRVDILFTGNQDGEGVATILLEAVKVLGIDQIADDRKDDARIADTVTLEVTAQQAVNLSLAMQSGTLSLVLRNGVTDEEAAVFEQVTTSDLVAAPEPGGFEPNQVAEEETKPAPPSGNSLTLLQREIASLSDRIDDRVNRPRPPKQESLRAAPEPSMVPPQEAQPTSRNTTVGVIRGGVRSEYEVLIEGLPEDSAAPFATTN